MGDHVIKDLLSHFDALPYGRKSGLLAAMFPGRKFKELSHAERMDYLQRCRRRRFARMRVERPEEYRDFLRRKYAASVATSEKAAKIRKYGKEYYKKNPEKYAVWKRRQLLRRYGMTLEAFDALLASQGMACALCRRLHLESPLRVDHDHDTGEVRGLLCHSCNVLLGHAQDDPKLLRRAAEYVEAGRGGSRN